MVLCRSVNDGWPEWAIAHSALGSFLRPRFVHKNQKHAKCFDIDYIVLQNHNLGDLICFSDRNSRHIVIHVLFRRIPKPSDFQERYFHC